MINIQNEQDTSWLSKIQSLFGVGIAFSLGLEDSINVNTLSFTLLFFYFLVYIVRTRLNVILCGIVCFITQFIIITTLIHGRFDYILSKDSLYFYVKVACGISALFFMIVGIMYFRDWWHLRFKSNEKKLWINLPIFLVKKENSESFFIVGLFISLFYWVISAVFGAGIIFLSSYALQDYTMFILLIDSISRNQFQEGQKAVFIYTAVFLMPYMLLWLISILYSFSKKYRYCVERYISIIKLILSSIFVSFGVGLLVTFYKM